MWQMYEILPRTARGCEISPLTQCQAWQAMQIFNTYVQCGTLSMAKGKLGQQIDI